MELQKDSRGVNADHVFAESGAIRRADLKEVCAGCRHQLGKTERAPNLDFLSARDHGIAARSDGRQGQE